MAIFLSIINFALSLLAIFMVIILFMKFSKVQQIERDYQQLLKEAEETIASYVIELKEENKSFLRKISKEAENDHYELGQEMIIHSTESKVTQEGVQELLGNNEHINKERICEKKTEWDDLTTYEEVAYLKGKDFSIEEIAKKMNKGKTEIELMWKFRQ